MFFNKQIKCGGQSGASSNPLSQESGATPLSQTPATISSCQSGFLVEKGMHIAVYLEEYKDEIPQIGMVSALSPRGDKSEVEVDWYMGCYSGSWKVCMCGGGRARKVWKEVIPYKAILMQVHFTKSMKLTKSTVSLLKEKYSMLM